MKQDPFFQNSVIVTGASLGIGRELALQLAEKEAWLTLAARSTDELERVAGLCRARGGKAIAVTTDVTVPSQCKALVGRAMAEYGRIDSLVNNAGIGMHARFEKLPDLSLMEKIMQVNYWGSVYCTYHALPHLKETHGRIVAVNSGGGKFVTPGATGYGASKHAMVGFFDSLRVELADSGVSITSIYPVWVATGISTRALEADGKPGGQLAAQEQNAMPPEQCARLILQAAARRKREVLSPNLKFGLLFAVLLPNLLDTISNRSFGGLK